ncbi:D,D-dipeptide ABC transporter permease [Phyllobacterium myrsinacearum]|uniref:Peptide/nickel transport system permease protein n=1 Tax=Phyllobacterium myrsinacearum TaxID=28101 RepID=A0A839EX57_9HYPH|nr:D,D-dipeptide ABC transporter permease [Phyllobacterium myrsinacearum]MBA8880977.1 peptide/nickel transport system permease protein [Phyllobacterium myrsinacearum]
MTMTVPGERSLTALAMLRSRLHFLWYLTRRSPLTVVGFLIILLVIIMVIGAPLIAPYDPNKVMLSSRLLPPSSIHWFGTDEVGRDLFSRVVYGSRASCGAAFMIVFISMSVGVFLGCLSGVVGGMFDSAMMRTMDVVLALPALVLAMALAAALGPSLFNSMLAVAIVRIPAYVRLSRGQTLSLRERIFVKASRTFGASNLYILRWHLLPNALSPLIVQATLDLGGIVLIAAALSFIGLGAQPPTAEWGALVSSGRSFILDQWWYGTFPGLAILVTAMGCNLLGDGIRDMLDPRLGPSE